MKRLLIIIFLFFGFIGSGLIYAHILIPNTPTGAHISYLNGMNDAFFTNSSGSTGYYFTILSEWEQQPMVKQRFVYTVDFSFRFVRYVNSTGYVINFGWVKYNDVVEFNQKNIIPFSSNEIYVNWTDQFNDTDSFSIKVYNDNLEYVNDPSLDDHSFSLSEKTFHSRDKYINVNIGIALQINNQQAQLLYNGTCDMDICQKVDMVNIYVDVNYYYDMRYKVDSQFLSLPGEHFLYEAINYNTAEIPSSS